MSRTATHLPTGPFKRTELGLIISLLFSPLAAWAAPHGGVVTSGSAIIEQAGSVTNINQSTQKAAINWQGFGIQAGETVNFNQPNASAITLNRVIGNERSVINGALNANGQVFLINSAGVLFGKGSSVNVGGLVASTRDISDADFNAGHFVFKGDGNGSVINMGTITAKDGGYVALLGNSVSNQGVIAATKGTVAMSAGNRITLNFNGDSLLNVTLDEGTLAALVENKQAIHADGGTVLLTAKAADELLGAQVNNSGIVRARTLDDLTGKIELYAHGGTARVDGTLDASAPAAGDGGFIETSGDRVKIADSAQILTKSASGKNGKWLVDPTDFTIAASGGDTSGAFLSNYLNTQGDYEVQSSAGSKSGSGDIHV
ncbi:MAG: filamentous hemagglutinin N-terminal domain-containing protein, partial [Castellaniella sp.]|uniref:filamentous hemagglutinin N-terminal domain-containing protein n=1 Tax=Castellaniella sp. TaxID=1955812 RepID=UPI002A35A665